MQADQLQLVLPAPLIVFLIQAFEEFPVLEECIFALLLEVLDIGLKLSFPAFKLLRKFVDFHLLLQLLFECRRVEVCLELPGRHLVGDFVCLRRK